MELYSTLGCLSVRIGKWVGFIQWKVLIREHGVLLKERECMVSSCPVHFQYNIIFNTIFFFCLSLHIQPTKLSLQLKKCIMGSRCYTKLVNKQKSKQKATLAFLFPYNSSKVQYMYVRFQL